MIKKLQNSILILLSLILGLPSAFSQFDMNTNGGTYQLVTSLSEIDDDGVYLIGDMRSNGDLLLLSTKRENSKYFSYFLYSTGLTSIPNQVVITSYVNSGISSDLLGNPYEYRLLSLGSINDDSYCLRDVNGMFVCNAYDGSSYETTLSEVVTDGAKVHVQLVKDNGLFRWNITNKLLGQTCKLGNSYITSNKTNRLGFWGDSALPVYIYKKISTPQKISIGSTGYSTLYYGTFDVTLPEGLVAFTFSQDAQDNLVVSHTYRAGEKIPQNTGVVIKGEKGDYTLTLSVPDESLPTYDNLLGGYDVATAIPEDDNSRFYMLSLNSSKTPGSVGFYWGSNDGAAFTSGAHKAYLRLPKGGVSSAKGAFVLADMDEITGIIGIRNMARENKEIIYDVMGRKVHNVSRGVFIQGGRKVVVH